MGLKSCVRASYSGQEFRGLTNDFVPNYSSTEETGSPEAEPAGPPIPVPFTFNSFTIRTYIVYLL